MTLGLPATAASHSAPVLAILAGSTVIEKSLRPAVGRTGELGRTECHDPGARAADAVEPLVECGPRLYAATAVGGSPKPLSSVGIFTRIPRQLLRATLSLLAGCPQRNIRPFRLTNTKTNIAAFFIFSQQRRLFMGIRLACCNYDKKSDGIKLAGLSTKTAT